MTLLSKTKGIKPVRKMARVKREKRTRALKKESSAINKRAVKSKLGREEPNPKWSNLSLKKALNRLSSNLWRWVSERISQNERWSKLKTSKKLPISS